MDFNQTVNGGFGFGLSPSKVSRQLRQLADQIDSGAVVVTDIDTHTAYTTEEFKEMTLAVTYNPKEE